MLQSLKYSQLAIRLSLALVFIWFGIHKFLQPEYWLTAWVPDSIERLLAATPIGGRDFIYLNGIFEVLVGTSLITTIFMRFFSALAVMFLVSVVAFHGFNEVIIRDFGLMGGFLALIFWPERRYSN